jgi:hypothetical protein
MTNRPQLYNFVVGLAVGPDIAKCIGQAFGVDEIQKNRILPDFRSLRLACNSLVKNSKNND